MAKVAIPSCNINLGPFTLFDCNFAMPRHNDVGTQPRDHVIRKDGTLWLRCYALDPITGERYKFKYYERPDGEQGLIVKQFVSRYGLERRPSRVEKYNAVRSYLKERTEKTKQILEKKKLKATIFHIKKENVA